MGGKQLKNREEVLKEIVCTSSLYMRDSTEHRREKNLRWSNRKHTAKGQERNKVTEKQVPADESQPAERSRQGDL